jgi:hypothetical protein
MNKKLSNRCAWLAVLGLCAAAAPAAAQSAGGQGDQLPSLPAQSAGSPASAEGKLGLFGYGEVNYYHPVHRAELTTLDLARAVFGISYAFDGKTQLNSEFETEHAVSSADDKGEFEVEQFYVDRKLGATAAIKAGVFLIPAGLLNLTHEPTHYYGVQRNFVEKLIIPTTWREAGVAAHGNTGFGLHYDAGVTTGFSLADWEINPETPLYRTAQELAQGDAAPFQAAHQEASLANAEHLAQYVSLDYRGVPGLTVGGSFFTGLAAIPSVPKGLPGQRTTLWEAHVRYNPGRLDLSALYARGAIGHTAAFNRANAGASNPEPAELYGAYVQAAYTAWRHGDYRITPFARWTRYDLGADYRGIPQGFSPTPTGSVPGFGPWPQPRDCVFTYGANVYLNPRLVLKLDYQSFRDNEALTRFDLGLGLEF